MVPFRNIIKGHLAASRVFVGLMRYCTYFVQYTVHILDEFQVYSLRLARFNEEEQRWVSSLSHEAFLEVICAVVSACL